VVNNPVDQWPKGCMWVSAIGLLIHFAMKLIKYLEKESRKQYTAKLTRKERLKLMNKKVRMLGFVLTMLVILAVAGQGIKSLIVSEPLKEIEGYRRYMYAMHGARDMEVLVNGEKIKLSPTEWMMDIIFRPEMSHKLPTFRVDNSSILEQADIEIKNLRDRYSFNQLKPHLAKLQEMFDSVQGQIDRQGEGSLSNEQEQLYGFMRLLRDYVGLGNPFIFNEDLVEHSGYNNMGEFFVSNINYVQKIEDSQNDLLKLISTMDEKIVSDTVLMTTVNQKAKYSKLILNPTEGERAWASIGTRFNVVGVGYEESFKSYSQQVQVLKQKHGDLDAKNLSSYFRDYVPIYKAYMGSLPPVQQMKEVHYDADGNEITVIERFPEGLIDEVKALENLQTSLNSKDSGQQLAGILSFKAKYADHIDFGQEGGSIPGEIALNKMSYFNNGIAILLFAGILMIAMCLTLGTRAGKILYWLVFSLVTLACLFTVAGIVHRSIIMDRSPIGTLYDTMPFIVGSGLILLLLIEWIHKKSIMLAVGIVFGVAILFLAKSFEIMDASDTLNPLVAVLKSNYWLSTHVVMITLGYMGGIVAGIIAHFYIIGRAFGVIADKETKRYLTTIVYGMLAFTLLFSLVGTILGGIWAADSWGRFWGWDPKENGALMIVIWMLVILHARLGGYIREIGLHVCSVLGFVVIVFSWWHVNFLGVGLHNYGFTSADAMSSIWNFYIMEFIIMLIGMFMAFMAIGKKRNAKIDREVAKLAKQSAETIS